MGIAKPRRRIGRPPLVRPDSGNLANLADRRLEILDAATAVFLEQGYDRTTLSQIIDRVGGSNRTLYAIFGDKAGLFTAVIEHVSSKKISGLGVLHDLQGDFEEALLAVATETCTLAMAPDALQLHRILIASMDRFPDIGVKVHDAVATPALVKLAEFFEYHSRDYIYRLESYQDLAKFFIAIMHRDFERRMLKVLNGQMNDADLDAYVRAGVGFFLAGAVAGKR